MRFRNSAASRPDDLDLAERRGVEHADAGRARRGIRARPRRACPRRRAGNSARASTGRHPRTRAPCAPAQSCIGVVRTGSNSSPRASAGEARRTSPACRAGGRSWCRPPAWRLPSVAGDDAERVQVRGLALVGRHAGRGVALDVLDRAEAFAQRRARDRSRSRRSGNRRRLGPAPASVAAIGARDSVRAARRAPAARRRAARRATPRGRAVRECGRKRRHAAARAAACALGRLRGTKARAASSR